MSRLSAREASMAQNVQTALATRVQDLSGAFRKRQANYMRRLRGLEERHAAVKPGAGAERAKEEALREDMELVSDARESCSSGVDTPHCSLELSFRRAQGAHRRKRSFCSKKRHHWRKTRRRSTLQREIVRWIILQSPS